MSIKISDLITNDSNYYFPESKTNRAVDLFCSNKRVKMDCYVSSITVHEVYEGCLVKGNLISSSILDIINFEFSSHSSREFREFDDSFVIFGMKFFKDQIPKLNENRCIEMKAENNELVFKDRNYYKFSDKNGNVHILECMYNHLFQPYSDSSKGIIDDTSNSAGIEKGLFSIQMGDYPKEEYYYSAKHTLIEPKSYYDMRYNLLTKKEIENHEVGSVYVIDGKEYTLNEDRRLDIPYGIDVFDIVYPEKSESDKG